MKNSYTLDLMDDLFENVIPFVKFCFENQDKDIDIVVNQESHCLEFCKIYEILDLFKFKSVTIKTANILEKHDKYRIERPYLYYHWFLHAFGEFDFDHDYSWNQKKIFGCFYGRPSAPRLGIASYLSTKYDDKSLIKVRFDPKTASGRQKFQLNTMFTWDADSLRRLTIFLEKFDQYQSEYAAYDYSTWEYDYSNRLNYLYNDIFVDIVCEAHLEGKSFYPTEKIVRSILCKKPFIVLAPLNYLKYLRQMGFKTFGDYWSEGYDDYGGGDNRYRKVLELIDRIASLSTDELIKLNTEISAITEHNYQLMTKKIYQTQIVAVPRITG
jgi:hypothetical protein